MQQCFVRRQMCWIFSVFAEIEPFGKVSGVVEHRRYVGSAFQIGQAQQLAALHDPGIIPAAVDYGFGEQNKIVFHDKILLPYR